jgi:hypothetical protein
MQLLHHEFHIHHFDEEEIYWLEWIGAIVFVTIVGALAATVFGTTSGVGEVLSDSTLMNMSP